MGTTVKCLGLYLYPVVRGMPLFFQIMCGLGLPPTWHSNTTLPPSTSFWTLGFLMKNGAIAALVSDSVMLIWDIVSSLDSSVTLVKDIAQSSTGTTTHNDYKLGELHTNCAWFVLLTEKFALVRRWQPFPLGFQSPLTLKIKIQLLQLPQTEIFSYNCFSIYYMWTLQK